MTFAAIASTGPARTDAGGVNHGPASLPVSRAMPPRLFAALLLLAALAGCASVPGKPAGALTAAQLATAEQQQAAREALLRRQREWSLIGRIAVSTGQNGGSGRIEWRQADDGYRVGLSAPVTRQSWQLSVDASTGLARLEGLDGGPRTGRDAGLLLREATGWEIPVIALSDWVRGLRASGLGAATIEFDPALRPARIAQAGWDISYVWPEPAAGAPGPVLPARIEARRADARVRLVVDQWNPDAPQ